MHTVEGLLELHSLTHAATAKLLRHCAKLSPDEFVREVPGFGFPTVHQQLFHIIDCEEWWLGGLSGLSQATHQPEEFADVAALEDYRQQIAALTAGYLRGLSSEELNTPRQFTSGEHRGAVQKPAVFFLHAMTHAFHHKGQTVAMCRLLGHPAPETDLID